MNGPRPSMAAEQDPYNRSHQPPATSHQPPHTHHTPLPLDALDRRALDSANLSPAARLIPSRVCSASPAIARTSPLLPAPSRCRPSRLVVPSLEATGNVSATHTPHCDCVSDHTLECSCLTPSNAASGVCASEWHQGVHRCARAQAQRQQSAAERGSDVQTGTQAGEEEDAMGTWRMRPIHLSSTH